jgi:hypothetical protein
MAVNTVSCLVQYYISGLLMIWLSAKTWLKSRELKKQHGLHGELRMVSGLNSNNYLQSHETLARICVIFTIFYCICIWPDGIADWVSNGAIMADISLEFKTFSIVCELCSALFLLPNLFIFFFTSRLHRRTLKHLLTMPYRKIARYLKIIREERDLVVKEIADPDRVDLFSVLYNARL